MLAAALAFVGISAISSPGYAGETANEHWVCAMPHRLYPSQTVIFDFQVAGDRLVEKSPANTDFLIVRNDDRAITVIRVVPILQAEVVGIDSSETSSNSCRSSLVRRVISPATGIARKW